MAGRRSRCVLPKSTLVLTLLSSPGFAFLSPPACSFGQPRHASKVRCAVGARRAAIAGGIPGGELEAGAKPSSSAAGSSSTREKQVPTPPSTQGVGGDPEPDTSGLPLQPGLKTGNASVTAEANPTAEASNEEPQEGAGRSLPAVPKAASKKNETKRGGSVRSKVGATPKAAPIAKGKGAPSAAAAKQGVAAGAVVGSKAAEPPVVVGDDAARDRPAKRKKTKGGVTAAPETTAAEKVLSLLELGLVEKEDIAAYYDALSNLERATLDAKEASLDPSPPSNRLSSKAPSTPQDDPLLLVPFPILCAALGVAGTHSLHLAGDLDTLASACGAIAGAGLGSLVVMGDDPLGRAARTAGSAVVGAVGAAGGLAGKAVSESAAGAAGAAVAAAEDALVKAPANAAEGLARSISGGVSSVVGSVAALPGKFAKNVVDGAKGALQDTSRAAINLPGDVARKAVDAAGGALQSTSDAALSAVKESPKDAAKRLKDAVAAPGNALTSLVNRPSGAVAEGSGKPTKVPPTAAPVAAASTKRLPAEFSSEKDEEEPEEIALEELEAKMSSVQEALERFDAVKNRIESAHNSETLREMVDMKRNRDMPAERERGEETRTAAKRDRTGQKESAEGARTRPPRASAAKQKPMDEKKRKQVAEELLEKASQRATQAKAGLKATAAARRQAESADTVAPTAGVAAEKPTRQAAASAPQR